jgi:hypothetical protein
MAFKCLECGHVFEEGEQAIWYEYHPYGMGTASEEFSGCPLCKGDYEETKHCKICGGDFLKDELNGGCVCDECLEGYRRDLEKCYAVAEAEKEEISINSLLVALLGIDEIEEILYRELESMGVNVDCLPYIDQDRDWFAERLIKEVRK